MSKQFKVSVIIPTYNSERFLRGTIDRVLAQTFTDYEILIVDDKSTDNTSLIVKEYTDRLSNVRAFFLQSNSGGPAKPKNVGIQAAVGKYIAFLDHDDLWYPEKLRTCVQVLDTQDVDMVFSNSDTLDLSIATDTTIEVHLLDTYVFQEVDILTNSGQNIRSCSGVMVKKSALMKVGLFDEKFSLGDDWDMWTRFVLTHKKISFIPRVLYTYVMHQENTMSTTTPKRILENFLQHYRKHSDVMRISYPAVHNKWLRRIGTCYMLDKQYLQARSYFRKAIASNLFDYKSFIAFILSYFPSLYLRVLISK